MRTELIISSWKLRNIDSKIIIIVIIIIIIISLTLITEWDRQV